MLGVAFRGLIDGADPKWLADARTNKHYWKDATSRKNHGTNWNIEDGNWKHNQFYDDLNRNRITHVALAGGTLQLPDNDRDFISRHIVRLGSDALDLVEIFQSVFQLAIVLKHPKWMKSVAENKKLHEILHYSRVIRQVVSTFYPSHSKNLLLFVCVAENKSETQIYFPALYTTAEDAFRLREGILVKLRQQPKSFDSDWSDVISPNLFRHGIRVLGANTVRRCECQSRKKYCTFKTTECPVIGCRNAGYLTDKSTVCRLTFILDQNDNTDSKLLAWYLDPFHVTDLYRKCTLWANGNKPVQCCIPEGTPKPPDQPTKLYKKPLDQKISVLREHDRKQWAGLRRRKSMIPETDDRFLLLQKRIRAGDLHWVFKESELHFLMCNGTGNSHRTVTTYWFQLSGQGSTFCLSSDGDPIEHPEGTTYFIIDNKLGRFVQCCTNQGCERKWSKDWDNDHLNSFFTKEDIQKHLNKRKQQQDNGEEEKLGIVKKKVEEPIILSQEDEDSIAQSKDPSSRRICLMQLRASEKQQKKLYGCNILDIPRSTCAFQQAKILNVPKNVPVKQIPPKPSPLLTPQEEEDGELTDISYFISTPKTSIEDKTSKKKSPYALSWIDTPVNHKTPKTQHKTSSYFLQVKT